MSKQISEGILRSISIDIVGEEPTVNLGRSESPVEVEMKLEQQNADGKIKEVDRCQSREDERTNDIIQKDRDTVISPNRQLHCVERTERIIEEAKKNLGKCESPNRKMRSTQEVLQLTGKAMDTPSTIRGKENEILSDFQSNKASPAYAEEYSLLSPAVSEGGCSVDDYEQAVLYLSSRFGPSPSMDRDDMLKIIDGVDLRHNKIVSPVETHGDTSFNPFGLLDYIWGSDDTPQGNAKEENESRNITFAPSTQLDDELSRSPPPLPLSNSFFTSGEPPLPCVETSHAIEVDSRMPGWMNRRVSNASDKEEVDEEKKEKGAPYSLGTSRTIVVHEVFRGNWTWCTAWSPDGNRLAVATENHNLAVVDTTSSTVWRVRHDKRIFAPSRNDPTNTIRAIAWGSQFIAIGGTGNCVSILAPSKPYPIIHTIENTGYVGSLHWHKDSNVLVIGSRKDKCSVFNITKARGGDDTKCLNNIECTLLNSIKRSDWVNVVKFSSGGNLLAIGVQNGKLSMYSYEAVHGSLPKVSEVAIFLLRGAVLAVEWSPDGKWLYAGGEDYCITIIDTASWKVVRSIVRERWVQFIASSHQGSHLAVGGTTSEVTILDANADWKPVMSIELKGLVPLSAQWHPKDQFLTLTGQDNSVITIETTNARLVKGFYLDSISPILVLDFSPDSCFAAVGNEAGLVSIYRLEGSTFVTAYEMVLNECNSQSIRWSADGNFVIVASRKTLVVIGMIDTGDQKSAPPNTSGFAVQKIIRGNRNLNALSIEQESRYIALGGETMRILDATNSFDCVLEWNAEVILANAWSPNRTWLATVGRCREVIIYDTSSEDVKQWRVVFNLQAGGVGLALTWSPIELDNLQYLAFGGENKKVTVIEIRVCQQTWETVLEVELPEVIYDLDWNSSGMLAAAVGDGTVTLIDLGYLQTGWAVNEMDYNWQRQGVTSFTEIRRSKGKNSMRTVRWMPPKSGDISSCLAVGGTDGALEVLDLTERQQCRGFANDYSNPSL